MANFLKEWILTRAFKQCAIDGYWCSTVIRLPSQVRTPSGGRITMVTACVDITFAITRGEVTLKRVRLSRKGGHVVGSRTPINVAAARTGEAWYDSKICSSKLLRDAVACDLDEDNSGLERMMFAKWHKHFEREEPQPIAHVINEEASPKEIKAVIAKAPSRSRMSFSYTKPNGQTTLRQVTIHSVKGNYLRARDHGDDVVKTFRIDRIANVNIT